MDRRRREAVVADVAVHPFAPNSFDLAFSRFGVKFFSDPQAAFINVRRAMKPGGRLTPVTEVVIEVDPKGAISVQDSGPRVSAEDRQRVFERFLAGQRRFVATAPVWVWQSSWRSSRRTAPA
jgi:ubiquinone/menaquinone biosynthesis C-methylase UbiE